MVPSGLPGGFPFDGEENGLSSRITYGNNKGGINVLTIIGALALGFILGRQGWLGKAGVWVGQACTAGVVLLLFLIGAKIGSDAEITQALGTLGLEAALYAVTAIVGSLLAVKILERFLADRLEKGEGG